MEETQEQQISKHSSGVSILIRIDGLWKDANKLSCSGKYSDWNTKLDVIWRELARDIKSKEWKEKKREFEKFDEQLISSGVFMDSGTGSFEELTEEQRKNRGKQYKILNEKELYLKRLENHLGKGTTFVDGDEDDFE